MKQANRHGTGERRICPSPTKASSTHPDLIPNSNSSSINQYVDPSIIHKLQLFEMQLNLDKHLPSLDVDKLTIGVNRLSQSPQDMTQMFCQGCQTDIVMVHDVGIDTRKLTIDSAVQSDDNCLNMYTQTEKPFEKSKSVQTIDMKGNACIQTIKAKLRNSTTQTETKYLSKYLQTDKYYKFIESSTETENLIVFNQATMTDNYDEQTNTIQDNETNNFNDENIATFNRIRANIERSESPPLAPDKLTSSPSTPFSFPFVSMISSLAIRLPSLGI